jgi:hypothetical protein
MGPRLRLVGSIAGVLAVSLAVTAIALAVGPVKGAKYSGHVKTGATLTVSFKVDGSGKKVTAFKVRLSLPNSCGYGGPAPTQIFKPAKIRHGRFSGTVTEKSAISGKVVDSAKVTGKFQTGGKERGTVKTTVPAAPRCNGTFTYSTKASKGH